MRIGRGVLAIIAVLAALAGSTLAESVSVVDTTGRSVDVPQPVERIASAYGIGTYYVYALGAGDRLVAAWYVGVKAASQAPASFRIVEPRLDQLLRSGDPNVEDLIALGTDFVIADGAKHAAFAEQMQGLGVPALLLAPETAEGVVETILTLGAVLGDEAQARAASLTADFYRVYGVAAVAASATPNPNRPRVLFLGSSPLQVASGAMYQTQLVEAAGGVSVSADLSGSWNTVSLEQILVWNPDVVVIPSYGSATVADIVGNADWQSVSAVRTGRVFKMPRVFGTMDTPLPESLLGVVWLSTAFYPERATFDVRAEAVDFYQTYYDTALSSAEADAFLIP
jgi:iron complex transport system substrate-binding protein